MLIKVNSTLYAVLTGFGINPASNGFVSAYMTRRLAMNASYVRALGGGGEPAGWSEQGPLPLHWWSPSTR